MDVSYLEEVCKRKLLQGLCLFKLSFEMETKEIKFEPRIKLNHNITTIYAGNYITLGLTTNEVHSKQGSHRNFSFSPCINIQIITV